MARLKEEYNKIKPEVQKELNLPSEMAVPRILKIVVNTGVSDATRDSSAIEEATDIITSITGQKPSINKAKKAVSAFKLREGLEIGVSATLRGDRMWHFFDKLVNVVMPRTKDFRGLSPKAFDKAGNYSLGIEDHTVFPEIDTSKNQKIRSLQVTIVTSGANTEASKMVLDKFGFPFKKDGKKV